jgi:hypothetical protein
MPDKMTMDEMIDKLLMLDSTIEEHKQSCVRLKEARQLEVELEAERAFCRGLVIQLDFFKSENNKKDARWQALREWVGQVDGGDGVEIFRAIIAKMDDLEKEGKP